MTLDERLAAAGLMADFLEAVGRRDIDRLHETLTAVHLDPAAMETLLDRPLHPAWAVRVEIARRFQAGDWWDVLAKQGFAVPAAPPGENKG